MISFTSHPLIFQHIVTFPTTLKLRLRALFVEGTLIPRYLKLCRNCTCSPLYLTIGHLWSWRVHTTIIFALSTLTSSPRRIVTQSRFLKLCTNCTCSSLYVTISYWWSWMFHTTIIFVLSTFITIKQRQQYNPDQSTRAIPISCSFIIPHVTSQSRAKISIESWHIFFCGNFELCPAIYIGREQYCNGNFYIQLT